MAARRDNTTKALMLVAVAVWGVASYFAYVHQRGRGATPSAATATAATLTATAAASPSESAVAAPSASAAATSTEVGDVNACVTNVFAPDSLGSASVPNFEFVCHEADPLKGGTSIRAQLVTAGGAGRTTDAMRDWAGLGWYEMAAYSMVRIQCCETVAPVHFTFDLACPVDAALGEWEKALKTRDATIIEEAIEGYHRSVRCLSQFGQSPNFGKDGPPGAGVTGLKRMIKRVFPD